MLLSILIMLALVCGREGSDVQDINAEEEISHAASTKKNDTETHSSDHKNSLRYLDSLLRNYDRRATPTNHLGRCGIKQILENREMKMHPVS